jgi:hypothetical protein
MGMLITEWLKHCKKTQADLARIIKRDRVRAHRIIKQKAMPNEQEMKLIFEATGGAVTANDFYRLPIKSKRSK